MAAEIIDGKSIAAGIRGEIKEEISSLKEEKGVTPGLAVVLVGEDPASQVYVRIKNKACNEVGIYSEEHTLAEDTEQQELNELIEELNEREDIHGILVQLPLPDQLDDNEVLNLISTAKDVDGFHPNNVGKLMVGEPEFVPCTPAGIIRLIEETGTEIKGKRAVVVGRSNIVGKPVAMLLLHRHATLTMCHSRTADLKAECQNADILVVATGQPEMITGDMVKPGAVVIDVGVNRMDDGSLIGDVEFDKAKEVAGHITPVPGGVGPMTIAMLLSNTLKACKNQMR